MIGSVTWELDQCLREFFALSEDNGSVPNTHVVIHNDLYLQFQKIWRPLSDLDVSEACTGVQAYMKAIVDVHKI